MLLSWFCVIITSVLLRLTPSLCSQSAMLCDLKRPGLLRWFQSCRPPVTWLLWASVQSWSTHRTFGLPFPWQQTQRTTSPITPWMLNFVDCWSRTVSYLLIKQFFLAQIPRGPWTTAFFVSKTVLGRKLLKLNCAGRILNVILDCAENISLVKNIKLFDSWDWIRDF